MIRKSDFKCLAGIIAGIFTMASAVCAADEATLGGQTLQPVMVGDDDGMYLRYQIDGSGKAPFVCDGDITVSLPPSDQAASGGTSPKNADRPLIWISADSVRITSNCRIVPASGSAVSQFDVLLDSIMGSGKADIADGADPLGDEAGRSGVLEYKDSSGTVFLPAGASFSPQNADAVRHTIWEPANAN